MASTGTVGAFFHGWRGREMPESSVTLPPFSPVDLGLLMAVLLCALVGLGYGYVRRSQVLRADAGTAPMREVAAAIQEGAVEYLHRPLRTMSVFLAAITRARWPRGGTIYAGLTELCLGIAHASPLGCACSHGAGDRGISCTV